MTLHLALIALALLVVAAIFTAVTVLILVEQKRERDA